ncbi:hypothetical protein P171DRAFT_475391 [Karstenula rhodostoma CBS 690.94]|uniref:Uncharacterized protein n=1 Tax=Karstenula rhodostoma CBS 690.94 TaxID=1392251 RepID=A0A9P4PBN3_9PLEO|nr:hypothetical protein P171DRAFT_475391 [Karstenula rhodostoma CBS 690.94]
MRRLKSLLHRRKHRSDDVRPRTAPTPVMPSPERQTDIRVHVADTAHNAVAHFDGAHSTTTVADAMQAPPDLRSYTHEVSPLAQNPAMIFAEPPATYHEQKRGNHGLQEYGMEEDQAEKYSESSDRDSEDSSFEEQLVSTGSAAPDNRMSIHRQDGSQFMGTPRETPRKQHEKVMRYSTAHSDSATFEYAESPVEVIAQPLAKSRATPLLMTINELRRETSIPDFGELESPSHKTNELVAEASLFSSFTEDLMYEIDGMIADCSYATLDLDEAPDTFSIAPSSITSFNRSESTYSISPSPSINTPMPSLVDPEADNGSPSLDNPRLLTPKHLAPTIPAGSHRQSKTIVTSVYPPRVDSLFKAKSIGRVSGIHEVETTPQAQLPPAIPERSLARPKISAHLAYLPRTTAAQAPVYISKQRLGSNFRGQWNVVDFGLVPKAHT